MIARGVRRIAGGARLLTLDPRRFFEERVGSYGIKYELGLLAVIGTVSLVGWVLAVQQLIAPFVVGGAVDGNGPVLATETHQQLWGTTVLESVVEIVVIWLYYALVVYAISWLIANQGTFFGLAKHLAWALYPLVFGYLIFTIAMGIVFWGVLEVDTDLPGGTDQNVAFLLDQGLTHPLMVAATLLFLPFVLWAGYLMHIAVGKVRGIDGDLALRVVAIPVGLHVLYLVWVAGSRAGLL